MGEVRGRRCGSPKHMETRHRTSHQVEPMSTSQLLGPWRSLCGVTSTGQVRLCLIDSTSIYRQLSRACPTRSVHDGGCVRASWSGFERAASKTSSFRRGVPRDTAVKGQHREDANRTQEVAYSRVRDEKRMLHAHRSAIVASVRCALRGNGVLLAD